LEQRFGLSAAKASQIQPCAANYNLRHFLHRLISFALIAMRIAAAGARNTAGNTLS
jgi:hypothetical protein